MELPLKVCRHWANHLATYGWTLPEEPKGDLVCYVCTDSPDDISFCQYCNLELYRRPTGRPATCFECKMKKVKERNDKKAAERRLNTCKHCGKLPRIEGSMFCSPTCLTASREEIRSYATA